MATEEEYDAEDDAIRMAIMSMMPKEPHRSLAILCECYAKACALYQIDDHMAVKTFKIATKELRPFAAEFRRIVGSAN